jgi:hypothetical protein
VIPSRRIPLSWVAPYSKAEVHGMAMRENP